MTMLTDFDDLDCPDNIGPDHTHIDPNPVILTKNDCMLFLRMVDRGVCLKDVCVDGLREVAPLIYQLDIPIDINIPESVVDKNQHAIRALTILSPQINDFIRYYHNRARSDCAGLFIGIVDIYNTELVPMGDISWRAHSFTCHAVTRDSIIGIDNIIYSNISKKIEKLWIDIVQDL